jgi:hypothetical protein
MRSQLGNQHGVDTPTFLSHEVLLYKEYSATPGVEMRLLVVACVVPSSSVRLKRGHFAGQWQDFSLMDEMMGRVLKGCPGRVSLPASFY